MPGVRAIADIVPGGPAKTPRKTIMRLTGWMNVERPDRMSSRSEFFAETPWYIHRPFLEPIDLTRSDEELTETEVMCRNTPGFKLYGKFYGDFKRRVPSRLAC